MGEESSYFARAFISCSLRQEDRAFIELVEGILQQHGIEPFGTVGRYSSAPMNPAEHMRQNIPLADVIVIIATPRYLQRDLQTQQISYGLSEMVHVETGMAYMAGKPVLVFVQEGTHVGSFLPNITEYVVLNGEDTDLKEKWPLIGNLLENTHTLIKERKDSKSSKEFGNLLTVGLAIWGGITIVDNFFQNDEIDSGKSIKRRR